MENRKFVTGNVEPEMWNRKCGTGNGESGGKRGTGSLKPEVEIRKSKIRRPEPEIRETRKAEGENK